jgi:hypothetical protein
MSCMVRAGGFIQAHGDPMVRSLELSGVTASNSRWHQGTSRRPQLTNQHQAAQGRSRFSEQTNPFYSFEVRLTTIIIELAVHLYLFIGRFQVMLYINVYRKICEASLKHIASCQHHRSNAKNNNSSIQTIPSVKLEGTNSPRVYAQTLCKHKKKSSRVAFLSFFATANSYPTAALCKVLYMREKQMSSFRDAHWWCGM